MMELEDNFDWTKEDTEKVVYFLENISGPWHPAQWGILIDFATQLSEWNGKNLPNVNPTNEARRSQLFVSTMMQGFIQALTNADYFDDMKSFYRFMYSAQSDKNYSLFKTWKRLDVPMEVEDNYWQEFYDAVQGYKENEDSENFLNYSDAEIANEMDRLKLELEEE